MSDDKYITFKRDEFDEWVANLMNDVEILMPNVVVLPEELQDAVVIRTQDLFAGPALHAYASSIAVAMQVLREVSHEERALQLSEIADYLFQRAEEADAQVGKLPD